MKGQSQAMRKGVSHLSYQLAVSSVWKWLLLLKQFGLTSVPVFQNMVEYLNVSPSGNGK